MGKKKSPKMAPLPDMAALEAKQLATNKENLLEQTTANRANQTNPFGSITWDRDPVTGKWTQTEAYNPEQQALYDTRLTTQGTMGKMAGGLLGETDLHMMGAPEMPTVGGYDQRAIDTIRALQAPTIAARENADRQRRAAMGLQGGERIVETSERNLADAASRADMQAILEGGTRGRQDVDQQMRLRGMYGDEQARKLGQVSGMMQGSAPQALQFGSYAGQGLAQTPDYIQNALAMFQAQQAQNNAKAASKSGGLMGTLAPILGQAAGAFFGGPAGAAIGSSIGNAIGGGGGASYGPMSSNIGGSASGFTDW